MIEKIEDDKLIVTIETEQSYLKEDLLQEAEMLEQDKERINVELTELYRKIKLFE